MFNLRADKPPLLPSRSRQSQDGSEDATAMEFDPMCITARISGTLGKRNFPLLPCFVHVMLKIMAFDL